MGRSRTALGAASLVALAALAGGATGSPASGRIVYAAATSATGPARYAITLADLASTTCRRLRLLGAGSRPILSPAGVHVATDVHRGQGESARTQLRVVDLRSGRSRLVAAWRGHAFDAAWSADGRRLAYSDGRRLSVVGRDGRGRRSVTRANATEIAWSLDGARLAFAATTGDGRAGTLRTTLDVIGVDGRGRRTLYVDENPYGSRPDPAWSPDAATLAFAVAEPSRIYAVPAGGGRPILLARGRSPIWSPDGRTIAFARRGTVDNVWTMAADGSRERRLTSSQVPPRGVPRVGDYPLAWSPDGSRIAYGRRWALATMSADGSDKRGACSSPAGVTVGPAAWTP
jgi:Tol biopolymer transport system component